MKKSVWSAALVALAFVFISCGAAPATAPDPGFGGVAPTATATSSSCPAPGTVVPIKKAMSPSFINDYQDCDIVVEASFYKMGNEGYVLGKYDTASNTTFQVLEPGGTPGALGYGIFAGIPKASSDILFNLAAGDKITMRGVPKGYFDDTGNLIVAVFHATSVQKVP